LFNLMLRLKTLSQEVRSNGNHGQVSKILSLICKLIQPIQEFHIDHLFKLVMNGLVILQLLEERNNGRDTTIAMLHTLTGLPEPINMSQEYHMLEELDLLKKDIVEIPLQIEEKSNGLSTITLRLTRTLTGTPTYPPEDHTTELLTHKMIKSNNGLLIHQPLEEKNNGRDIPVTMQVTSTGQLKQTETR